MTLATTSNRISYTANGSQTAFPYNFLIKSASDIKVYVAGVLKTLTTHYTVGGVGNSAGGNVTFLTAPTNASQVLILREVTLDQQVDYSEGSPFPAETHEGALDKLTMIAQQLSELLGRSIKLAVTSLLTNITFPDPLAGKFIRWNTGGTNLENADVVGQGSVGLPLVVAQGGTGAADAPTARTNLGIASTAHKDTHKSGGSDALASTDLVEAHVKRLLESGGTTLLAGAIADGQFLKRSSTNLIGAGTPQLKFDTFTRDLTAAAGTQAIIGVGFTPKILIVFGAVHSSNAYASWGMGGTGPIAASLNWNPAQGVYRRSAAIASCFASDIQYIEAQLQSLDTDGFTLNWTNKVGSPTGAWNGFYLAIA